MVRHCDGAATAAVCSIGATIFLPGKQGVYRYGLAIPAPIRFRARRKVIGFPSPAVLRQKENNEKIEETKWALA
jgi:hypothetical protein